MQLPKNRFGFKPAYPTDKFESGLIHEYINILQGLKCQPITFLEIGVAEGGSLNFFADYFEHPDTKIVGFDLYPPMAENPDFRKNCDFHICDQNDNAKIKEIADQYGAFDIILDDGAHFKKETENCFDILFPYLKPGGYYLIEDWTAELIGKKYAGMIDLMLSIIKKNIGVNTKEFTLKMTGRCSYLVLRKRFK